uniref:Uncharacterized protein n=1 Tax=Acrobeloides nanus TaxID=290746 RepID=A0A914EC20_9BILA
VYRFLVSSSQITHGKVRISRIIFRHKREDEEIARPEDFITIHESDESSDVLKDEHWFLYVLDKDYAYFVLLPKEISHYNIINYPFMFTPVFEQAIKVAEMPLDDFIEWSKEIENKKKTPNTVLFTNTARCASTLFGSMLQHEEKSVVFAEPHVLAQLSGGQSEGLWRDEELEKLVPASIRAIRKNIPSDQICIIKTTSSEIKLVPYTKLMHDVKYIFMFRRNAVDSVEKSTYRSLGNYAHKMVSVYLTLYKFSPSWYNWIFGVMSFSEGWLFRMLDPKDIKEWAFIVWIAPYLSYRKFENQFCYPIVWHHELIKNTEMVLKGVFKSISEPGHGELNEDCILKALERLKVDSQGGTFLSQEVLKSVPITPYTDEAKKRLKKFVEKIAVPTNITGFDF